MTRILPYPLLSIALLGMWLLLTRVSAGHVVLGAVIAVGAGLAYAKLDPTPTRPKSLVPLVRLAGIVFLDIIRSNLAVARLMLTNGRHGARRSAFVKIPLRTRNPVALALLAMIVTATPGTAWLEYDAPSGILLLHVFDMIEEAEWIALIQDRYEALLLEAFE